MEIVLYQINSERDYHECEFMDYQYTEQFGIDPFSYDRVWSGHLEAKTLDEVFSTLNGDIYPNDYMGRSMSISDICEVVGADGQSKFYFVDRYADFKEVEFDSSLTREAKEREITVVACYPGKTAEVITIPNTLKAMQEFVSHGESHSMIEAVYPSSDPIAIICNEEGKLWNLPLNRAMYSDRGEMIDVIAGNFFVCGLGEEDFASLRGDLQEKYLEKFKHPEKFMKFGNQVMAFKMPEKKQTEESLRNHIKHK